MKASFMLGWANLVIYMSVLNKHAVTLFSQSDPHILTVPRQSLEHLCQV